VNDFFIDNITKVLETN